MKRGWYFFLWVVALAVAVNAQIQADPEWRHHITLVDIPQLNQFRVQSPAIVGSGVFWVDNRDQLQGTALFTKLYGQFYDQNNQPTGPTIVLPQEGIASPSYAGSDTQGNHYLVYISDQRRITLAQVRDDPPRMIYSRQITTSSTILYIRPTAVIYSDKIYLTATKAQAGTNNKLILVVLNLDGSIARSEQQIVIPGQGSADSITDAILAKDQAGSLYVFYKMQVGSSSNAYALKLDRASGAVQWNTFVDTTISSIDDLLIDDAQNKVFLAWTVTERINNQDTTNIFFGHADTQTGQPTTPRVRITNSEWYHTRPDLMLSDEGLDIFYEGGRSGNAGYDIYDNHLSSSGPITRAIITGAGDSPLEHAVTKQGSKIHVFYADGSLGHRRLRKTHYQPTLDMPNPRQASTTPIIIYASRQNQQNAFIALSLGTANGWLAFDGLFFLSYLLFPSGQIVQLDAQGRGVAQLWLPGGIPSTPFYIGFVTFTDHITAFSDVVARQTQP